MANSRKSALPNNGTAAHTKAAFERALEEILARVVVSSSAGLALAYSGGLDSSVLLRLLSRYCASHDIALFAFHIHHGLSPHADAWVAHAERQARAVGAHFVAERVTLIDTSLHGIEQAARLARYAALGRLCRLHQLPLLLTAHHQDDQAETVLLQLLRGAGLPGLAGMGALHTSPPLLGGEVALGRPLLNWSRAQLAALAQHEHIDCITDESNSDTRYRRNAVRQLIAPVIEQNFPGFTGALARSSNHLQSAQKLLDALAAIDLQHCQPDPPAGGGVHLASLSALPEERIDNVLRYWVQRQGAPAPSTAQLGALRQQMLAAGTGSHPVLQLSGITYQRQAGWLIASSTRNASRPATPPEQALQLQWQGEPSIALPSWQGRLVFQDSAGPGLDKAYLLAGPLSLRARSGSERLKLDSRRPSRSLKNLFQESGIPARDRPWLPLLYAGESLVLAAGLGIDVRAGWVAQHGVVVRWEPC